MHLPSCFRLVGLLSILCCIATAQAEPAHEIKDPHYGDTLFQFFQDHYFTALTELMASQQLGRVEHHTEEAEVLRGGILLAYGLHREAGDIFTRLIDMGASPQTRDRAWFYLAKIRYQRGYFAEAEEAIERIGSDLPSELQEEKGLLHANLLMQRAAFADAATVLNAMDLIDPDSSYVRFNLGIALIKSSKVALGDSVLDKLGQAPAADEEYRSLRDRVNLALGFSALAQSQPLNARHYLERVRLKSQQANKALLGLGWSAIALKDPKLALVPWMELAQRDVNETAVLEAKIAVPYAYAELGAYSQSAKLYNQAIEAFALEDHDLAESINAIKSGKLVDALMEVNPSENMGWFGSISELPTMPDILHPAHFTQMLAQHEFQEAFKNYRDLLFLMRNLKEWHDKLSIFDDMLANRRNAFSDRLPQTIEQANKTGIDSIRLRQASVVHLVATGENEADGVVFADAKQRDSLSRLTSMQNTLNANGGNPEFSAARDRVHLAGGALIWQLAQDYPARLWQAKKDLQEISNELDKAQQREAGLIQAQHDEPEHFGVFATRIAANAKLLDTTIPRLAKLISEQQQAVQYIAIAELIRQQERLAQYATQAKFAVAQLYDRGTDRTVNNSTNRTTKSPEADSANTP